MLDYNRHESSTSQRITMLLLETLILIIAGWILFFHGSLALNHWFSWNLDGGNMKRNILLFSLLLIVFIRMFLTIFILLKRSISWEEALTTPIAFFLYYVGYSLLGVIDNKPLNGSDVVFILLFLVGSFINTYSEVLRARWKKNPENKGKLYTEGLFRYSIHINYFGDVVWVTALALLTWNTWSYIIPILLVCLFVFYNIPILDQHLEKKYGDSFRQYQLSTKKLIPFIY